MKFFTVRNLIVVLTLTTLIVGNSIAQELTLNDCIELALQKRASIIAAYGSEDRAKADKKAAIGAFLPRLDASYAYSKANVTDIESDQFFPTAFDESIVTHIVGADTANEYHLTPTAFNKQTVSQDDQDRKNKSPLHLDLLPALILFKTYI